MSDEMRLMQAQLFQGQAVMQHQGRPQSESNHGQQPQSQPKNV